MKKTIKILIFILIIAVAFGGCGNSAGTTSTELVTEEPTEEPTESPAEKAKKYNKSQLIQEINEIIEKKAGSWSVYVGIPTTDFKLTINNSSIRAASVIKLFNMVAFYNELHNGSLDASDSLYKSLNSMITVSSNTDSNVIVKAVGGGSFDEGAKKVTTLAHDMGCTDTQEQHQLYDVGGYAVGKNATSVRDCGAILTKLYEGECVSQQYDKEMIKLLKKQTRDWKIPQGLPEGTVVANKTGEHSKAEWDVAIVYSPECDYVICVAVTDFGAANVYPGFAEISKTVYEFFNYENMMPKPEQTDR